MDRMAHITRTLPFCLLFAAALLTANCGVQPLSLEGFPCKTNEECRGLLCKASCPGCSKSCVDPAKEQVQPSPDTKREKPSADQAPRPDEASSSLEMEPRQEAPDALEPPDASEPVAPEPKPDAHDASDAREEPGEPEPSPEPTPEPSPEPAPEPKPVEEPTAEDASVDEEPLVADVVDAGEPLGDLDEPGDAEPFGDLDVSEGRELAGEKSPEQPPSEMGPDAQACSPVGFMRVCYTGPASTQNTGNCRDGIQSCTAQGWSVCQGERVPAQETCNGEDDDCDGLVDELMSCPRYVAFPATGAAYAGQELIQDPQGNLYIIGRMVGSVTFGSTQLSSQSVTDVYVTKVSPTGQVLWAKPLIFKKIPGTTDVEDFPTGVVYAKGYLYVAVTTYGQGTFAGASYTAAGRDDCFVLKMDARDGKQLWFRNFGGSGHDGCTQLVADSQGDLYVLGYFSGAVSFDQLGKFSCGSKGSVDLFALKMDAQGQIKWLRCWGGPGWDAGHGYGGGALAFSPGGKLFAGGYFNTVGTTVTTITLGPDTRTLTGRHGFYVVLNPTTGAIEASALLCDQTTPVKLCLVQELRFDPQGNLYIMGEFSGTAKLFGRQVTSDANGLQHTFFLAKVSLSAQFAPTLSWLRVLRSPNRVQALDFVLHPTSGDLLVTGYFNGSLTVANTSLTSVGQELFMLQLRSSDGTVRKSLQGDADGSSAGQSLLVGSNGTLYITTVLRGTTGSFGKIKVQRVPSSSADGGLWLLPGWK